MLYLSANDKKNNKTKLWTTLRKEGTPHLTFCLLKWTVSYFFFFFFSGKLSKNFNPETSVSTTITFYIMRIKPCRVGGYKISITPFQKEILVLNEVVPSANNKLFFSVFIFGRSLMSIYYKQHRAENYPLEYSAVNWDRGRVFLVYVYKLCAMFYVWSKLVESIPAFTVVKQFV